MPKIEKYLQITNGANAENPVCQALIAVRPVLSLVQLTLVAVECKVPLGADASVAASRHTTFNFLNIQQLLHAYRYSLTSNLDAG